MALRFNAGTVVDYSFIGNSIGDAYAERSFVMDRYL